MMLPKLHYLSQGNSPQEHLDNIQKACTAGAELVQLCLKDITEKEFLKIAKEARYITAHFQTLLIIKNLYKIAKEVKADGVHFEKIDSYSATAKKYLYSWQIIGGTANNLQECEALINKEIDYLFLGPFRKSSANKSLKQVLGLNGYTVITEALNTKTPILGIGGITTEDVTDILKTGISGIAASEEITQNFNTISTFNQLLKASSTAEQRFTF